MKATPVLFNVFVFNPLAQLLEFSAVPDVQAVYKALPDSCEGSPANPYREFEAEEVLVLYNVKAALTAVIVALLGIPLKSK